MRLFVLRSASSVQSVTQAEHVSPEGLQQIKAIRRRTLDLCITPSVAYTPQHIAAHETAAALCPQRFTEIHEVPALGFVYDDERLLYRNLCKRFEHRSALHYIESDGSEWLLAWAARAARAVRDEIDQEVRLGDYRADAGDVVVVCQNRIMVALFGATMYPQHAAQILAQPYGPCEGFVADPRSLIQVR